MSVEKTRIVSIERGQTSSALSWSFSTPRLLVAGLSGDSGKTLVSLGLCRALKNAGLEVAGYKKGPDFIDAAWLEVATGRCARHLDTFLMDGEALGAALRPAADADIIVTEGNRGLFDGADAEGTHSSAQLARRYGMPVLLVIDVKKMTRTAAALVLGCVHLDPNVNVAGVVLNNVATSRQERVIRDAIARLPGAPPVVGSIPRLRNQLLPGRHLGLVTAAEHPEAEQAVVAAARAVQANMDIDAILEIARRAPALELPDQERATGGAEGLRIGVLRDEAFTFYYPENLESLERRGATLVNVSPLSDEELPDIDALLIGGGFPEVYAAHLSRNITLRRAIREASRAGMPIYAECGGLMYLARELIVDGRAYPMVGVFEVVVELKEKPQGHGYVLARADRDNPFHVRGQLIRAHEFHYSSIVESAASEESVLELERGTGIGGKRDGLCSGRTFASYMHVHSLGAPDWNAGFLRLARTHRDERLGSERAWG